MNQSVDLGQSARIRTLYARTIALVDRVLGHQPLLYAAIALALVAVCAVYLNDERFFPYWDLSAYQDATYTVSDAFGRSLGEGFKLVAASMNDDYNLLLTVALVPLVQLFGQSRFVYIADVIIVYYMPYVIVMSAIARRVFPERAVEAGIFAALATVATPMTWNTILLGYADIAGAVFVGGMLLAYDRSDHGVKWRPMLLVGVLAAIAVLMRRHYVYAVLAADVAIFLESVVMSRLRSTSPVTTLRAIVNVVGSGIVMLVLLGIIAPEFLHRVTNTSYAQTFAAWQVPPSQVFAQMIKMIGAPVLIVALFGAAMLPRVTIAGRSLARTIVFMTATWVLVWGFFVRQGPIHYPHAMPFFAVMGVTAAWLFASRIANLRARTAVRAALAVLLVLNTVVAVPIVGPAQALGAALPPDLAPVALRPRVDPAYNELTRLIFFMRAHANASDPIVVAASSHVINGALLQGAERALFGPHDTKLQIVSTPQVDSLGEPPPAGALKNAKFVIVAEPFQYHLRPEDQKEIHMLVDAFEQHWPVAGDFRELPDRFSLGPAGQVLVYERVRPDSLAVAADTQARMQAYLHGGSSVAGAEAWVEQSSPYPVGVSEQADGSFTITGNPAQPAQQPKTIVAMLETAKDDVRISGDVRFLDSRCIGTQLLFGTEYHRAEVRSAGTFRPAAGSSHFAVTLQHARGNPVYLKFEGAPGAPNVDYCTVTLDHVRAERIGRALSPQAALALQSAENPFPAPAPAAATAAAPAAQAVTWLKKSSPYPNDVTATADGSYVFSGHPTRRGQQPETVIELQPTPWHDVLITGTVTFYTPQCKGAQILAGTDYGSTAAPISAGVFTPKTNGARFEVDVSNAAGKPVYLNFKSNPQTPDDIDYCTLRVEHLQVRGR